MLVIIVLTLKFCHFVALAIKGFADSMRKKERFLRLKMTGQIITLHSLSITKKYQRRQKIQ